jgi:beta-galactosidase GanA
MTIRALLVLTTVVACLLQCCQAANRSFYIENNRFYKDGVLHRVRAGEIHYARVPPEYWHDRLQRIQAMGLNTIQVYVPWNWHESAKGQFDFTTPNRDLVHFLQTAQSLGLMAVLRAGPYICGEWDFGGLPGEILK